MDAAPDLLTSVEFAEARKGYDRTQVDTFLRELGSRVAELKQLLVDASARADAAESRAADAERARGATAAELDEARATIARLETSVAQRPAEDQGQAAAGILAMAQKTADATIEDATLQARAIAADAREAAARAIAEMETEVAVLRDEQRHRLQQEERDRLAALERDVDRLLEERALLARDVDRLTSILDEQRGRARNVLEGFLAALDEDALAVDAEVRAVVDAASGTGAPTLDAPEAGGTGDVVVENGVVESLPAIDTAADAGTDRDPERDAERAAASPAAAGGDETTAAIVTVDDLVAEAVAARTEVASDATPNASDAGRPGARVADLLEGPSSGAAPEGGGPTVEASVASDAPASAGSIASGDQPRLMPGGDPLPAAAQAAATPTAAPEPSPTKVTIDLTSEQLFAEAAPSTGAAPSVVTVHEDPDPSAEPATPKAAERAPATREMPVTQSFDVLAEGADSSFGATDEEADAAMRAFFDSTEPGADAEHRSRFLRRR